ncbi:unnamed protein product [Agarophyton chilense]|eukprot:gb/GEZJ01000922.1/.p1 GENE.gb/GEZJ01000922.1/~~gb/GEZJ01000922.1/.p1  ORF type:complete len:884 (+),score=106.90 gb/GEZJ01000922.1/:1529-4180(+)
MHDTTKLHVVGVPVHFPFVPYRAQNALMHAVVTAVRERKHALIESPTGTGKSLALLCSSLAVQEHFSNLQDVVDLKPADRPTQKPPSPQRHQQSPTAQKNAIPALAKPKGEEEDDDIDFASPKRFRDTSWQNPNQKRVLNMKDEQPENTFMFERLLSMRSDVPLDTCGEASDYEGQEIKLKVPRIFYATRTHSQVAQVIAELRKTKYTPSLSILASRKEYCVNDMVKAAPNRDEACKLLLSANNACLFSCRSENLANSQELDHQPWDIEELVELGKKHCGCPYYASHHLYQKAQLILCPYSFLIDPICKKARGINVSGDIVIFDEAHNIESYARESASFDADVATMSRAAEHINKMLLLNSNGDLKLAYSNIKDLLYKFVTMTENIVSSGALTDRDRQEDAVFERDESLIKLNAVGISSSEIAKWKSAYEFIVTYSDSDDSRKRKTGKHENGDNNPSLQTLSPTQPIEPRDNCSESTAFYGYGRDPNAHNLRNDDDDVAAQSKKPRRTRRRLKAESRNEIQAWVSRGLTIVNKMLTTLEYLFEHPDDFTMIVVRRTADFVTVISVSICCLNAAICFREISSRARSVIVTSGTLTPISSFAGELGTTFSISKTLPHVVNVQNQLFVGIAGEGPKKVLFDATFRGSSTFAFQDALGDALVDYCEAIPGGVLVFFPSYRMMDQLHKRWSVSGAWNRLENTKGILLMEPNQRGEDFDNVVDAYQTGSSSEDGALLLAVCRGKLSEGIDFRDDTSRGVILIGIPFPYIGDIVVKRKKAWNDRTRQEKKRIELQSGGEWYEMQAFRAMNQALGRALRHRYDYGAILLVDCRFRHKRVYGHLPRWTRKAITRTNSSHEDIVHGLEQFYKTVQQKIVELAEDDRNHQLNRV